MRLRVHGQLDLFCVSRNKYFGLNLQRWFFQLSTRLTFQHVRNSPDVRLPLPITFLLSTKLLDRHTIYTDYALHSGRFCWQ
jgi:hypothetical protein